MRQIKFRGKRISDGVWLYGDLMHLEKDFKPLIKIIDWSTKDQEVDPDTVSQFTGLTDKNGKEVYEGDIVKVHIEGSDFVTVVTWGKNSRGWKLKCDRTNIDRYGTVKYYSLPSSDRIEIIGSIHDNPELLNEKQ